MTSCLRLFLVFATLASTACTLSACTSGGGDDADSADEDLKKKVGGSNTTYATVETATLPWYGQARFENRQYVNGQPMLPGTKVDLAPGTYPVKIALYAFNDTLSDFNFPALTLAAGQKVALPAPVGVKVVRKGAITWDGLGPKVSVLAYGDTAVVADSGRRLDNVDPMVLGRSILVPSDKPLTLRTPGGTKAIPATPGQLVTVEIPVATATVELEAVDPAYPTPTYAASDFHVEDSHGQAFEAAAKFGTRTVRAGAAIVLKNAWGASASFVTSETAPTKITLHRLEVDPISVTKDGATKNVWTRVDVEMWKEGRYVPYARQLSAPFGIDVLEGKYRVKRSDGMVPAVQSTDEVSFP
jgi:hypothetical protein